MYKFWNKQAIFISAEQGYNVQEIWKKIDSKITPEILAEYNQVLRKRRKRIKKFKNNWLK